MINFLNLEYFLAAAEELNFMGRQTASIFPSSQQQSHFRKRNLTLSFLTAPPR